MNPQAVCYFVNTYKRGVTFKTFHHTNIGTMEFRSFCKFLLRKALLFTKYSNSLSEHFQIFVIIHNMHIKCVKLIL